MVLSQRNKHTTLWIPPPHYVYERYGHEVRRASVDMMGREDLFEFDDDHEDGVTVELVGRRASNKFGLTLSLAVTVRRTVRLSDEDQDDDLVELAYEAGRNLLADRRLTEFCPDDDATTRFYSIDREDDITTTKKKKLLLIVVIKEVAVIVLLLSLLIVFVKLLS